MKASTPIVPSLGLNAVRLSLLSGAVTAALGAPRNGAGEHGNRARSLRAYRLRSG